MKNLRFNADMMQAVLDGRKTMTRRPIKEQLVRPSEEHYFDAYNKSTQWNWWHNDGRQNLSQIITCPYGEAGDIIELIGEDGAVFATARIKNIRVERLQDISEDDAKAEGARDIADDRPPLPMTVWSYSYGFEKYIWDKLPYKAPYDWNSNPWVWVIEFEKATQ